MLVIILVVYQILYFVCMEHLTFQELPSGYSQLIYDYVYAMFLGQLLTARLTVRSSSIARCFLRREK